MSAVLPVAKVLVIPFRIHQEELQILLLHRPRPADFWQPVTGGVEDDETLGEAALRELREETGLTGELLDLGLVVDFLKGEVRFREACFAVAIAPAPVQLSVEHDAHAWLGAQEALERIRWEGNRAALARLIDSVTFQDPA